MGAVQSGKLKPWRAASEIIDWSIGTPSIFQRKKPLAANTMRRISLGIQKFILKENEPFQAPDGALSFLTQYYTETNPGEVRGQTLREPIYTIPTANRFGLVKAF
jgi:DNA (cytosine-5)-methyltransferase 1